MELEHSIPHRLDAINAKLNKLLATCSKIKILKDEICGLREELKSVRDSLDFANQETETLKHEAILYNEAEQLSSVLNFQDLMHNRVCLIFLSLYKNYFGSICFI